jgi:hypothetical protein
LRENEKSHLAKRTLDKIKVKIYGRKHEIRLWFRSSPLGDMNRLTHIVLALSAAMTLAKGVETEDFTYTLQQRVERSKAIVRVSVTSVSESLIERPPHVIALCDATVLEVLKGTNAPKKISFQFYAKGPTPHEKLKNSIPREKLRSLVGHEYFVFLHQIDVSYRVGDGSPEGRLVEPDGKWWVLDDSGFAGLRPVKKQIEDFRIAANGKRIKETMSRAEFISRICRFAQQGGDKTLFR